MGYFANGTEGTLYEEKYCNNCRHNKELEGCPVMNAHMLYNYEECENDKSILHMLIPRKGVRNLKCKMFIAKKGRPDPDDGEPQLFETHEMGMGPQELKEAG